MIVPPSCNELFVLLINVRSNASCLSKIHRRAYDAGDGAGWHQTFANWSERIRVNRQFVIEHSAASCQIEIRMIR